MGVWWRHRSGDGAAGGKRGCSCLAVGHEEGGAVSFPATGGEGLRRSVAWVTKREEGDFVFSHVCFVPPAALHPRFDPICTHAVLQDLRHSSLNLYHCFLDVCLAECVGTFKSYLSDPTSLLVKWGYVACDCLLTMW